jgi:predicted glutamine amidotransferase
MCRWLAYLGEPLRPSLLILDTKHSLVAQALDSPLGKETVNGDGFGFGWYSADPAEPRPFLFHSIEPAWNDENLREITESMTSPLFFSHVRAAAAPPVQQTNCHPFRYGDWMFMHNGYLAEFSKVKRDLTFAVDPSLYPHIHGTTDSEVLFHLALTNGLQDDPVAAMTTTIGMIEETGRSKGIPFPMQGTLAVTDGTTIWAFRYSSQGRSRTLFHSADVETMRELYPDLASLHLLSDNARVVVSEPLNDLPGMFVEIPESSVSILSASGDYHTEPFLASAGVR